MNRCPSAELFKVLQSCQTAGIAEWNDCVFRESPYESKNSSEQPSKMASSALNHLQRLLPLYVPGNMRTFVTRKVYKRMASIADDGLVSQETYSGQPLPLEDHFGDISVMELKSPSSGFDQSYLVAETDLQEILSNLCCLFTSGSDGGASVSKSVLKSILPMVIFYKCTKQSNEPSGVSMLSFLESNDKTKTLLEQRITVRGPYPSTNWRISSTPNSSPNHPSQPRADLIKFHAKSLKNLTKQHLGAKRHSIKTSVSMESYAEYELLESNKPLLENQGQDVSLTYVTVCITCNQVSKILQSDVQHITAVNLKVTPVPGDMRSSAFSLFKTIQILEGHFSAFGESGEVKWTSIDDEASSESPVDKVKLTMLERVQEVIASYGVEWMVLQRERKKAIAADEKQDKIENSIHEQSATTKQMIIPRQELDFTERVWEVLKYVGSCQELVECFNLIMEEVTNGRATQFWLHRNNKTTLAMLIKESYVGQVTTTLDLSATNCIMLLIEMGLDKLGRDYRNFFISNRLASSSRLAEYFSHAEVEHKPGETLLKSLRLSFTMIKKLHHITELIVQCKLFLCLSDERIFSITKSALQSYISRDLDFDKTFEFPIAYSEIEALVKDCLPSVWKLNIKSVENTVERLSSHCWMTEYPFKGIISRSWDDHDNTPSYRSTSTGSAFDITTEYYIASQTPYTYALGFFCGT